MRTNGRKRAVLLALVPAALVIAVTVFVVVCSVGWPIGSGPPAEMSVVLAWNGEQASIPAPVRYPRPGDIRARRFPWLRGYGSMRNLTTVDSQGRGYVANMLGVSTDPQNPQGRPMPHISCVSQYDPNGQLESSTLYALDGPVEWYNRHPDGEKNIQVPKTGSGLSTAFHDAQGQRYKEWLVNKRGQVYRQQIKQDRQWITTHDLKELTTSTDVPWGDALREFMEYYPGRSKP